MSVVFIIYNCKCTYRNIHKKLAKLENNETIAGDHNNGNNSNVNNDNDIHEARRKIYFYSHSNFFWRKVFALGFALPWEASLDLWIETQFSDENEFWIKILFTIGATIILAYIGLKFVIIQQKHDSKSNSSTLVKFLKGYHINVEKTETQAQS